MDLKADAKELHCTSPVIWVCYTTLLDTPKNLELKCRRQISHLPTITYIDLKNIKSRLLQANQHSGMKSAHNWRVHQRSRHFVHTVALLLFAMYELLGQTLNPVPGFLQDVSGQFPLPAEFSLEQQIQIGTQGNSTNDNPFAYGHALQFRPWLHCDGIPNTTLTGSASYIYYFTVPGTSYYRHPEWGTP